MTSAGSGIVHEVVELLCSLGRLGGPDGFDVIFVEVLHTQNLPIATQEALIFLERKHHDARHAVPLDTNRVKHGFVGIISELPRNLLGRDRQHNAPPRLRSLHKSGGPLAPPKPQSPDNSDFT